VNAEKHLRAGFRVRMGTKRCGEKNLLIVFIVTLPWLRKQLWLRICMAKQIKSLKILN